jgi:hypothetical protein
MNGEDHSMLVLSIRNDPASTARRGAGKSFAPRMNAEECR